MTEGEQRMTKALEAAHWRIKELERENAELRERLARFTNELDKQMRSRDSPADYVMQY